MSGDLKNMMSVDLEDWFCVYNFHEIIPYSQWDTCQSRVEANTERLLDLFDHYDTKATFFVLGWIAERFPSLIRTIAARGHEIASHGYSHRLLTKMSPEEFREDLRRGLDVTRRASDQPVVGFRAPSFSVTPTTTWALDIMTEYGIQYDSSIFPIGFHPDYGMPSSPLGMYRIRENLLEIPMSCVEIVGRRVPCSGGGYFRQFPYSITRRLLNTCNAQGRPFIFYIHPWEIDPEQPKMPVSALRRFRHYHNLDKTFGRLQRLMDDFSFTTIQYVIS